MKIKSRPSMQLPQWMRERLQEPRCQPEGSAIVEALDTPRVSFHRTGPGGPGDLGVKVHGLAVIAPGSALGLALAAPTDEEEFLCQFYGFPADAYVVGISEFAAYDAPLALHTQVTGARVAVTRSCFFPGGSLELVNFADGRTDIPPFYWRPHNTCVFRFAVM